MKSKFLLAAAALVILTAPSLATEQIYRPVSPTFNGNPLNGNFLLSTAQAQGMGAKSGSNNTPDLSGLSSALSNIGSGSSVIVIGGTPTTASTSP
ncbi:MULTISPECIES: curli assembly protein CsgF [Rhodopseudomonas]|uniref:Curli production assembly/transport component CsgF n=1 Tax=Rhodopseudomonas palustris (strain DX-1) TaxID=652103 RepID=E6VPB2_RHOPX|nr:MULTISPECIES: curli assembly protein CsgF [Rhodopseudomonas]NEW86067.1 curli assembly protein CsgF [Rhodopseudomonas sp. WA056]QDL97999.1 curli assembly protein CsgF [Rhodopseudomonas palustris]